MICKNCGSNIPDESNFCTVCGTMQTSYQQINSESETTNDSYGRVFQSNYNKFPMKWYKFVIYIQLILAVLSHVSSAILYFTGEIWSTKDVESELVYSLFPNIQGVDIAFGFISIGLAILAICIRYWLKNFKQNSPIYYIIYVCTNMFMAIIYSVIICLILENSLNIIIIVYYIFAMVIHSLLNYIYFNKRKELFVN